MNYCTSIENNQSKPPKLSKLPLLAMAKLVPNRTDRTQFVAYCWCPYCRTHHLHVWDRSNARNKREHRNAHCQIGTPFDASGYLIGFPRRRDCEGA